MFKSFLARILGVVYVLCAWSLPVWAQDTLSLQITFGTGGSEVIELSLDELDALQQSEFTTTTIWTDGNISFSGVPLKPLLDSVGANGTTVEMVALNDYLVSIPFMELEGDAPLLATRMNGETMSVRDKGPFWIVFPYDSDPKYRTETKYAQSIWQLNRLKVVD